MIIALVTLLSFGAGLLCGAITALSAERRRWTMPTATLSEPQPNVLTLVRSTTSFRGRQ